MATKHGLPLKSYSIVLRLEREGDGSLNPAKSQITFCDALYHPAGTIDQGAQGFTATDFAPELLVALDSALSQMHESEIVKRAFCADDET